VIWWIGDSISDWVVHGFAVVEMMLLRSSRHVMGFSCDGCGSRMK